MDEDIGNIGKLIAGFGVAFLFVIAVNIAIIVGIAFLIKALVF